MGGDGMARMNRMGWKGWKGWKGWDSWVAWPQYDVCDVICAKKNRNSKTQRIFTLEKPCGLKTWYPCAVICVLPHGVHGI